MAKLFWAFPDSDESCFHISPDVKNNFNTGSVETESILLRLAHNGIPNLEYNLKDNGEYLLVAQAGPLARHYLEKDHHELEMGLPNFSPKGVVLIEQGAQNYGLIQGGITTDRAGYFAFYRIKSRQFSLTWKVTCPFSCKSRIYLLSGDTETGKVYCHYTVHTI